MADLEVSVLESPFSQYLERTRITPGNTRHDLVAFFNECRPIAHVILDSRLQTLKGLKFWICVSATYHRSEDPTKLMEGYFPNHPQTILHVGEINEALSRAGATIGLEVEGFEEKGSSWVIQSIDAMEIYTVGYTPLRASCFNKLPDVIRNKRAIINVQNEDNRCFMWSVLASLHPAKAHGEKVSQYSKYIDELDFEGVSFPVKLRDIGKFTANNNISINVFTCGENDRIRPIYRAEERLTRHVNLFYYNEHYSCIRSFDRLMGDQNRHDGKKHFCDMCLFPMYDPQRLKTHQQTCTHESLASIEMPKDDEKWLKFKSIQKMLRKPLVCYADFEAILKPLATSSSPKTGAYTEKYQEHVPCSYGMVLAHSCCKAKENVWFEGLRTETGEDPASSFLDELIRIADNYAETANKEPLNMSQDDIYRFHHQENCHICDQVLNDDRVRDHCHACGHFRGAAHNHCNQMLRLDRNLTVVMHNSRRYDTHIIMRSLGKAAEEHGLKLSCIPKGMENYVTFTMENKQRKWKIRFVDSAQFLAAPLAKLVELLPNDKFKCMQSYFEDDEIALLCRKGVFCYDFLDSWEKLGHPHPIPKQDFFNKLNNEALSDADYDHYLKVVQRMECRTLKEYLETYLKLDVTQLADVFENFRKFTLDNYGLDPCHYNTLPGLAWEACLKLTKVELELLTDPDMYTFFESAIRGGISVISHRFAKANNEYMKNWSPQAFQAFLLYIDANNLYGCSMQEILPHFLFRFMEEKEIENRMSTREHILNVDADGEDGYVLEVDLEYPEALHDKHNCYPLAPEKLKIKPEMLSQYSREIAIQHELKLKETEKLAPNLCNKRRYIVHIKNLQYYLKLGLILRKVHRVLTFKQSRWLAPYVEFNTNMRKQATSEFEKSLYKFFVNAVFGKTMENVRKYITVELVTSLQRMKKVAKKPTFKSATIFTDNLVACSVARSVIKLNKPIYIGFTVLELSKLIMYRFHYDYMQEKYGNEAKLCMTDTDSFLYLITTKRDVYKDMLQNIEYFDTSDYPESHFLYSTVNKKVPGKMKDELPGETAEEFVGLRSKMYSLKSETCEKKRAKGVKRKVVADEIEHEDYANTLNNGSYMYHKMRMIRSNKHKLFTIEQQKKSLSSFDDKRYILEDGISTLAYGHKRIKELRTCRT